MPRRIFLVRHCQSQANAEGRVEGKGDSPLSEAGRAQAQRLAAFVAAQNIGAAALIASPLSRARATADAIAALCGWTPSHDHRIREAELGWMEDMSYADLRTHMIENKLTSIDHDTHGGESFAAIAQRFSEALNDALAATENPLVLVSHGFAIHAIVQHRFGHELSIARIGNGDVFELWLDGEIVTAPPTRYPLG